MIVRQSAYLLSKELLDIVVKLLLIRNLLMLLMLKMERNVCPETEKTFCQ